MGGGVSQKGPPPCIADLLKNAPGEKSGEQFHSIRFNERLLLMAPSITPAEDRTIPHQELVEAVIDERIEANQTEDEAAFALQGTAVIASPNAVAADLKVAVDAIRAALTASGVTA